LNVSQASRSGNSKYLGPVIAAALGLFFAALPAGATAGANPASPTSAAFTVHGTNGFSIDVESEGGRVAVVASERRPPIVTFSQGGRLRPAGAGNGASSIYYARGSSSDPRQIEARLGRIGRIAVSFHSSGKVRVTELNGQAAACAAPRTRLVRRLGTFSGTVEFRGEDGYTAVRATRVRGSVGTPLPRGCPAARAAALAPRPWPSPGSARLDAVDRRAGTHFKATITDRGAAFLAVLQERQRGGLVVSRRAYAGAPPGTFTFDDALTSARVRPPAPFLGSARFVDRGAGLGSWVGTLAVTFPGVTIPMTGSGFRTTLGQGR
jgi:hypothetical protein